MKKRIFATFLILALLLAALAGCGQDNGGGSKSSGKDEEEAEQLLGKGWYVVYDEDDELAGYLEVKSSKITVYNEVADEEDTLRYEYNAKKDLYILENGKLFGSEEFTVEKHKKVLTLITEDEDEYTLEEIDKEDMPGPGTAKTPGFDDPVEGNIELPLGCYAAYDGRALAGYLEVTGRTLIFYESEGEVTDELYYSYEQDGSCTAEQNGTTITTFRFTYERGGYYMSGGAIEGYLLEPIQKSEIPVYEGGSSGTSAPAASDLDTIRAGKLTIATSPDYPPFEYYDDNGNLAGIDVEIMELICEKLGLEPEFIEMDFDGALMAAEWGECDVVASGVIVTEERGQIMSFTDSYYTDAQVFVVPEGSGVTPDDLDGQLIAVLDGSAAQIIVSYDYGDHGAVTLGYDAYAPIFEALLNGLVDCAVVDRAAARSYAGRDSGLVILEPAYIVENYAFGVARDNDALLDAVNGALGELIADGAVPAIVDKYVSY